MFKIPMKFADVFVLAINIEDEEIVYTVRDKDTGICVEPLRHTKFIVNDVTKVVHFDAREVSLDLFSHIYQVLK
jgi:hypothetical protein